MSSVLHSRCQVVLTTRSRTPHNYYNHCKNVELALINQLHEAITAEKTSLYGKRIIADTCDDVLSQANCSLSKNMNHAAEVYVFNSPGVNALLQLKHKHSEKEKQIQISTPKKLNNLTIILTILYHRPLLILFVS